MTALDVIGTAEEVDVLPTSTFTEASLVGMRVTVVSVFATDVLDTALKFDATSSVVTTTFESFFELSFELVRRSVDPFAACEDER